jgi:D-alanyl-D-alanine carboxypeptidase
MRLPLERDFFNVMRSGFYMISKMIILKIAKFFSIISILIFLLTPISALANITPAQAQQIQKLLDHWRSHLQIPAAAISISMPDNSELFTFLSGTTTMNGSQKITSNTLFQAGSISKSFTSMMILQLEAQDKIYLDDSITKYLPQYPKWQNITIRELLNHTSGIVDYTKTVRFQQIRKANPSAEFTPATLVNIASNCHSYFSPGKGWKYSNTNYVLAGMIIEAVTRQPISKTLNYYLHQDPKLNLPNTFYLSGIYSQTALVRMANGYDDAGKDVTSSNMSWAYTAGAIVSTTNDLLTWWKAIFQNHILPQKQIDEMMTLVCEHTSKENGCIAGKFAPHLEARQLDKRYGLGVIQSAFRSNEIGTVWWHNGSTQGYKAIVMWFPKSNIYLSLMIDRDPGFLLTPNLPIIRNLMHVLLTGSYVKFETVVKHHHKMHKHKMRIKHKNGKYHKSKHQS